MKFRPERAVCMAIILASFEEYYRGCTPMEYDEVFNLADHFMENGVEDEFRYMQMNIAVGIDRPFYERENMLKEYTKFVRIMDGSATYKELKDIRYDFEEYYRKWDEYHEHDWDGLNWLPCKVKED